MASQKIKGLTVEIGGDTSELSAALKKIDKESKNSAAELKEINRLLKLDPSNTEALAQKQTVLAQAIGSAKERLDVLVTAQTQAQAKLAEGEIGEDQYRALQREVVYAEKALERLVQQQTDLDQSSDDAAVGVKKLSEALDDAEDQAKNTEKEISDLSDKLDAAKDSAQKTGAEMAAGFAVAAAGIGAAAAAALEYEDAAILIQSSTAATQEELKAFSVAAENLYLKGLGEDLSDVSVTVSSVAQATGEVDSSALERLSERAIVLRDVFGYEVPEQMTAVKHLMEGFGITADEAFDLVASGTQRGLNKNGDFLDVLSEFSVHYSQLGYSAESFIASLLSGSEAGAFSVSKVGDAVKEFGIRTKDSSAATTDAYKALGFDVELIQTQFAAGGDQAQKATATVLSSLFALDDAVQRNEIGVALFGSTWEDLGEDAIKALSSADLALEDFSGSMNSILDVQAESTRRAWSELGRTIQVDLLRPLGDKLLPTAKSLLNFSIDHIDQLIPLAKGLGLALTTVFAVEKSAKMIKSVRELVSAYKALKAAQQAAQVAQASSGWGAIIAAIGAVVGMIAHSVTQQRASAEAAREQKEAMLDAAQAELDAISEVAAAELASASARRKTVSAISTEFNAYNSLAKELETLVDAEGRVLKGNEERVAYITSELSDAMGDEIELIDGQIQRYNELKTTIGDVLAQQRLQRSLTVMESDYLSAKDNLSSYEASYEDANADYNALIDKRSAADSIEKELFALNEEIYVASRNLSRSDVETQRRIIAMQNEITSKEAELEALELEIAELSTADERRTAALVAIDEANQLISLYEGAEYALATGSQAAINSANEALIGDKMLTAAGGASVESLLFQAAELMDEWHLVADQSKNEGSLISSEDVAIAKADAEQAILEAYSAAVAAGSDSSVLEELRTMLIEHYPTPEAFAAALADAGIGAVADVSDPGFSSSLLPGFYTGSEDSINLLGDYLKDTPIRMADGQVLQVEDPASAASTAALGRIERTISGMELVISLDGEVITRRLLSRIDQGLGAVALTNQRGELTQ